MERMPSSTYSETLAGNVAASRVRRRLNQANLAARMQALGYRWVRQTVSEVEAGRRRLNAEEVLGLSFALETSMAALYAPAFEDRAVDLPSGAVVSVATVRRSASGYYDGSVLWRGDVPVFAEAATDGPIPTVPGTLDEHLRRHAENFERTAADPAAERHEEMPVVAAIVTSGLGVLVGRRRDGRPLWTFIAGEQDAVKDENPADTAVREVKEETGLRVQAGDRIGERVHPKTGRTMIYMAAAPTHGTDVFVGDEEELAEVRWVSLAELDDLMGAGNVFEPVHEHLVRELGEAGGR
jgi:8-oxo-dGTP diphosphatase